MKILYAACTEVTYWLWTCLFKTCGGWYNWNKLRKKRVLLVFLTFWCKIVLLGVRRVRQLQSSSIYFSYVMTSRVYYIGILPHKFSACIFLLLLTNSWHIKEQSEWHSHTNIRHSPCVFQYRTRMMEWSPFCSWYTAAMEKLWIYEISRAN
jgi:hypothetical protein